MHVKAARSSRAACLEPLEPRIVLDSTVVFNEIMYNVPGSDDGLEWIELHNQNAIDMDVSAWQLTGGVAFTFPEGTVVPGGGYVVIAADPQRLRQEQGVSGALGPFVGQLANGGETIELRERSGRQMDVVEYEDGGKWPVAADGSGATLAKAGPNRASGSPANWTHSVVCGGTPGGPNFPDAPAGPPLSPLEWNEVAAAEASPFFVELINRSARPTDLGGYVLATSRGSAATLPAQVLDPGGLAAFTAAELSLDVAAGDHLFLYQPGRQAVADAVVVDSRLHGRTSRGEWWFAEEGSPGAPNRFLVHDAVVVNEIMYHAPGARADSTGPLAASDEEWIELVNRGDTAADLTGWQLTDAIQFAFPAGTTLAPGAYLVVARDAATLAAEHPAIHVVGDFAGRLDNGADRIVLVDAAGNPADVVPYFDDGRWPAAADRGGSSLELRDPNADNSRAEAWAASDESLRSTWQTYTYRGVTSDQLSDPDGLWHELVIGLLEAGEVWLDDIRVVEDPDGTARQLVQNGSFQDDVPAGAASTWRAIGNHRHSQVLADPDEPGNQVWRLVATGPTEHMHNHAGTTLKDGSEFVPIRPGTEYEISFRAKWISGSNQLNTRLYFYQVGRTTLIERPTQHGTPGVRNSVAVDNVGPTYAVFRHTPTVPSPFAPVTVSVAADDADGVAALTLWYSVKGGPWQEQPMAVDGAGVYAADIPGQAAATIVQFYVAGRDGRGAVSAFPANGQQSRALYKVEDGLAADNGLHNLRLILTPDDADFLHNEVELMSNDLVGATIVYNEHEVFYDVGVRLSGSQRARPYTPRLSFAVTFGTDQLFRGVHRTLIIDRSESTGFGQRELLIHHGMAHAGGFGGEYNDLIQVIPPRLEHTGPAELQMARFTDVFLDSMFLNGSDGQLFEYEGIYRPSTTDDGTPEGRKRPQPDVFIGKTIRNLGIGKELARWFFQIKNNREADDFTRITQFAKTMRLTGAAFNDAIGDVIDVDQYLRAIAVSVISGAGDNYASGNDTHNAQFYVRPEDKRVLLLPHDLDAFFDATRALISGDDLRKLMALPERQRLYLGHVHDIITTTFNRHYMARWTAHFGALLPAQDFSGHLAFIDERASFLLAAIERSVQPVDFAITSGNGAEATVNDAVAMLAGTGWINVRQIRLAGSHLPLDVRWDTVNGWQVPVHVGYGANDVTLEAYDFQGHLLGSATIVVQSTAVNAVRDPLRITEINYNPYPPTAAERAADPTLESSDFEFIEVRNTGVDAIPLGGVRLVEGVQCALPSRDLGPRESALIVSNRAAFQLRYGTGFDVLGEFSDGNLDNGGETITLEDSVRGTVLRFTYDNRGAWPTDPDGQGPTLELIDARGDYRLPRHWRSSFAAGGTPGSDGPLAPLDVLINELVAGASASGSDLVELYNVTDHPVDLSGWYLSDDPGDLLRYVIPGGTSIDAGGYLLLDAVRLGVELELRAGGELWLIDADARTGSPRRVADGVRFDACADGHSLGRWPNGLATGSFVPMASPTRGSANSGPVPADVVLSEVNYHPCLASFSHDFVAGPADAFAPQLGTWWVEDGYYKVIPGAEGNGDTVATIPWLTPMVDDFAITATIHVPAESAYNRNGVVIFDYHGPTDFKFASMHPGSGRWHVGSRDESGWRFLAESRESIARDVDHQMVIEITGPAVRLLADGVEKIRFDFGTLLADGLVGIGSKDGEAYFKQVVVEPRVDETRLEYVELTNTTEAPVDLSGWRLTDGAGWSFADGSYAAGQECLLLVAFDPADDAATGQFRRVWDMDDSVRLVGPFTGSLSNDGETLKLVRPLDPGGIPARFVLVDRVAYRDRTPWPHAADGNGRSLSRNTPGALGALAASWRAAAPTPGTAAFVAPGDVNLDRHVDVADVSAFALALADQRAYEESFGVAAPLAGDIDGDGDVDFDDIDDFVAMLARNRWAAAVDQVLAAVPAWAERPLAQRGRPGVGPTDSDRLGAGGRRPSGDTDTRGETIRDTRDSVLEGRRTQRNSGRACMSAKPGRLAEKVACRGSLVTAVNPCVHGGNHDV